MAKGRKTGGREAGTRNKATADIKAIAQPYGQEAVTTLAQIMRSAEHPPAARVSAAKELLDRGFGKPQQSIDHTSVDGTMTPRGLSDFYAGIATPAKPADTNA